MPGVCVAFAGSNRDVKPNDRLPIIEQTHETCCNRKRCIVQGKVRKATRATQRTQTVTNGYFGGYIGKRQPAGNLETRKCIDKLFTLRAKIEGKGKAKQLRACSGRLITELEMNSTYRGAVEIFNLCSKLDGKDLLNAECIRTFVSQVIDGKSWMCRLETSQIAPEMKNSALTTYVPATRRPNVRTKQSTVNPFDAYGLRPLEEPWKMLSAYEFLQQWRCEPLLIPTSYDERGEKRRTAWTQAGKLLLQTKEYRESKVAARPGTHFIAVEPENEEYFLFPAETGGFHHSWVLVRRRRPAVVVIENLPKPSVGKSQEYNSQYCSLFFRPWTLYHGNIVIPPFELLGLPSSELRKWHEGRTQPPVKKRMKKDRRQADGINLGQSILEERLG